MFKSMLKLVVFILFISCNADYEELDNGNDNLVINEDNDYESIELEFNRVFSSLDFNDIVSSNDMGGYIKDNQMIVNIRILA